MAGQCWPVRPTTQNPGGVEVVVSGGWGVELLGLPKGSSSEARPGFGPACFLLCDCCSSPKSQCLGL